MRILEKRLAASRVTGVSVDFFSLVRSVEKGYGFIAVDGQDRDVFVHQSDIYAPGFRSLAEGEALEFRLITDERSGKEKAVDVTGPDGSYVQGAPKMPRDDDDEYY